tara:strand:- start:240 stop:461 length:222 start_codon:yes stop_codon:yes gene_type:complete
MQSPFISYIPQMTTYNTRYSKPNYPSRIKNVSYAGYEVDRIWEMEEKLCKHHGKNFSQLHKDLVRKEYATITM